MSDNRKRRCDRLHVIYRLDMTEGFYIGLTVNESKTPQKSAERRLQKHLSRARRENKEWSLYRALGRILDSKPAGFPIALLPIRVTVLTVVRGREMAHTTEREMIRTLQPNLNTF